jgi:hypothetical protein
MKKALTLLTLLIIFVLSSCTESTQRNLKSIKSNWTGGLNRKVEVYDYNGGLIKSWEGRFDVRETDQNSVYFDDADGKRVIISGGIIINEEIK